MLPAFVGGMPGTPELILLILTFLLIIPVMVLVVGGVIFLVRRRGRVAELEAEVDALRSELQDVKDDS